MPFDDKTALGYTTAYFIQCSGSGVICTIIYTINSFFFGACKYIEALLLDLKSIFDLIDVVYANRNKQRQRHQKQHNQQHKNKNQISFEGYVKIQENLHKFLKLHVRIIRYTNYGMQNVFQ